MRVKNILLASFLLTLVSLPSFGEYPSREQTTWHGGISPTIFQNYFDPYFLEETGTAWQSAGQLSLDASLQ